MSAEERLEDLEIRLMHQEAAIDELSASSYKQQNQLNEIKSELQQIRAMLRQLSSGDADSSANEPPPHY